MKTYLAPVNEIERKWYLVDAENKVLGRLASEIANRLRGKHKPTFSSFIDNGDFIVVTNAEKVQLTGNKLNDKKYYRHTGWMGGIKETSAKELLEKHPTDLLIKAVKGMLPRNKTWSCSIEKAEGICRKKSSPCSTTTCRIRYLILENTKMAQDRFYATGKRKTAVARVWLTPGTGKVIVNEMEADAYFGQTFKSQKIVKPFKVTETMEQFDVIATLRGGGKSAQVDALSHGISKALLES